MKIQTLKDCFALMNATLLIDKDSFTVEFKGITVTIDLSMEDEKLEAALWFINTSMPNWFNLVKESLAEEKGGEV